MLQYSFAALLAFFSTPVFATTIQSNICGQVAAPVFSTQNSTTAASTTVLEGTTTADVSVAIKNNTQQVATITSDDSGDFSLQVSLAAGTNSFTATGTNDCSSASSVSPVVITREAPTVTPEPETPIKAPSSQSTANTPSDNEITEADTEEVTTSETTVVAPQTIDKPQAVALRIILPPGVRSTTVGSGADARTTVRTSEKTIYLKGVSAPLAAITISNNDVKVASLTAASDGSFGVSIPLSGGTNILAIEASYGGITTTQILTYIRSEETNPVFIIGTIAATALVVAAGATIAIRNRLQSKQTRP